MASSCPACPATRRTGHYLCPTCWNQLPAPARRALARRDQHAPARLRQLHAQLTAGLPVSQITIAPETP
jgi:uncharacterized Zn finger protein (UPF0148 family)